MLRSMRSSSALRLPAAAVIVTGAQFMYISRLPTLLNQVQAKVAVPVGRVVGTTKVYVEGSGRLASLPLFPATPFMGHPPSMEWITLNTLLLVGAWSYVIEN
jgi:hypothetical protein